MLDTAERFNNTAYPEVENSGLGLLYCLGAEVYGRWGKQSIQLVPVLARERTRDLHVRIRRGAQLGFQHRWWGLLGMALQKAVARAVLREAADMPQVHMEAGPDWTALEQVDA